MVHIRKAVWFGVLLALAAGCSSPQQKAPDGFVTVQNGQFRLDGRRYCFLGTNVWYGANLAADSAAGGRARLRRELDLLCSLGMTNLRILGASEGGQFNTVRPSIQPEPGVYRERILRGLDYLLAEMGKRGMRAVIFLNNFWVWSGGMSQYMSWVKHVPVPNPFLPQYQWTDFMNFSAAFYGDSLANGLFRRYVRHLLNRRNTVNGVLYREDPTIMSWQLANEPRPGWGEQGEKNFPLFREWIGRTARFIRKLDPNHLISTGNEGLVGCNGSEELFRQIHRFPDVDYMTFHLWILNWRWYDPRRPEETFPTALAKAVDYIGKHIRFAEELGKPIVLEEFGIPRDGHSFNPAATTRYRDRYFSAVFEKIYRNARAGGPLVGSNFWAWGGEGRPRDPANPTWRPGDPYTGDPPQEPQGRNSVFDSDRTTLKILREYAARMNALR